MRIDVSDRLVLVGTSHIAHKSIEEIKAAFTSFDPDIVGLELDNQRLHSLLSKDNEKPSRSPALIKTIGVTGYVFLLIASFIQKRLGGVAGMEPGSEMKEGYFLAKNGGKRVLLIDQPIQKTLKNLSRWPIRERFRVVWDVIAGPFQKKNKQHNIAFNIKGVPSGSELTKILSLFKGRYPKLHQILVADRDQYMVRSIKAFHERFPDKKLLAIVGAGHTEGMMRLLSAQEGLQTPTTKITKKLIDEEETKGKQVQKTGIKKEKANDQK